MAYYVYILQSQKDGTYYIGSTHDIESRLDRHNQGRSQYTKTNRPWKLIYQESYPDRSSAAKRETEIKRRKKRSYVEQLVRTFPPVCVKLAEIKYDASIFGLGKLTMVCWMSFLDGLA